MSKPTYRNTHYKSWKPEQVKDWIKDRDLGELSDKWSSVFYNQKINGIALSILKLQSLKDFQSNELLENFLIGEKYNIFYMIQTLDNEIVEKEEISSTPIENNNKKFVEKPTDNVETNNTKEITNVVHIPIDHSETSKNEDNDRPRVIIKETIIEDEVEKPKSILKNVETKSILKNSEKPTTTTTNVASITTSIKNVSIKSEEKPTTTPTTTTTTNNNIEKPVKQTKPTHTIGQLTPLQFVTLCFQCNISIDNNQTNELLKSSELKKQTIPNFTQFLESNKNKLINSNEKFMENACLYLNNVFKLNEGGNEGGFTFLNTSEFQIFNLNGWAFNLPFHIIGTCNLVLVPNEFKQPKRTMEILNNLQMTITVCSKDSSGSSKDLNLCFVSAISAGLNAQNKLPQIHLFTNLDDTFIFYYWRELVEEYHNNSHELVGIQVDKDHVFSFFNKLVKYLFKPKNTKSCLKKLKFNPQIPKFATKHDILELSHILDHPLIMNPIL